MTPESSWRSSSKHASAACSSSSSFVLVFVIVTDGATIPFHLISDALLYDSSEH